MEVIEVGDEDVDGGDDDDDDSYLQFFLLVEFLLNLTMCYIYYLMCLYKQCEKINTLVFYRRGNRIHQMIAFGTLMVFRSSLYLPQH